MTEISKYKSGGSEILFEPGEVLPGNFIEAKKYLNSVFLETGRFEDYAFSRAHVSDASDEERDMYIQLKDRSIYLIGKDY